MTRALVPVLLLLTAACGNPSIVPDPPTGTGPITAPAEAWTWVGFPEAKCMNGTPTGIGVNLTSRSRKVLVFLEGGGACFNAFTCATVANPDGYGETQFTQALQGGGGARGVFDRADADNPFRDWSYVYVPYCTGDVHSGSNPDGPSGRQHVGYANLGVYLARVVPTFADATEVVLAGSSAGGFGAAFNYERVQRAFGTVPVHLLDDSGPVFSSTYLKPCLESTWRSLWKLDASLPEGCAECRAQSGGLVQVLPYLARTHPDRRFGLVSSTQDETIRYFFGFGYTATCDQLAQMPAQDFTAGLDELRGVLLSPTPNFRMYTPAGRKHTYLHDAPLGATSVGGVKLTDWVRGLVDGTAGWGNVP